MEARSQGACFQIRSSSNALNPMPKLCVVFRNRDLAYSFWEATKGNSNKQPVLYWESSKLSWQTTLQEVSQTCKLIYGIIIHSSTISLKTIYAYACHICLYIIYNLDKYKILCLLKTFFNPTSLPLLLPLPLFPINPSQFFLFSS